MRLNSLDPIIPENKARPIRRALFNISLLMRPLDKRMRFSVGTLAINAAPASLSRQL